jgi:hypothetical protein
MAEWLEVSEEYYDEMLGVVPPAIMEKDGFLVGEPTTHRVCAVTKGVRATYAAFRERGGKFFEHDPMTVPEYRADKFWVGRGGSRVPPYGDHLPDFPSFHGKPTEEQLECTISRLIDRADAAFLGGKATECQYRASFAALNTWSEGIETATRG